MELTGTLISTSAIKTFESGYQIQEFYIDYSRYDQYTGERKENILKFQIGGNRMEYLNMVNPNDKVKVYFTIDGKFYAKKDGTGKAHFQTLNAYKIERMEQKPVANPPVSQPAVTEYQDDLPF